MTMRPYPPMHPLTPAKKETSFRLDIKHPKTERVPEGRNLGCVSARRYPNGRLCYESVVNDVIEITHKAESGGKLNSMEMALISMILPFRYCHIMDPITASAKVKLSDEEKLMIMSKVMMHFKAELAWADGSGCGSTDPRKVTKQ